MRGFQIASVAAAALANAATAMPSYHGKPPVHQSPSPQTFPDGFPSPINMQLNNINRKAGGKLSDAPPPAKLANGTLDIFQAVAFGENLEVAFFTSLLNNVTHSMKDSDSVGVWRKQQLVNILTTVVAQEELHALNAINVLNHFGVLAPLPCRYQFPTTSVFDAVSFAEALTTLVLGTLQDVSQGAAKNGDDGVVRAVASVIGQEGEQEGFYRVALGKKPSEKPFLTTNVGPFLFSFLQQFVVKDSCPFPIDAIKLPVFTPLTVQEGHMGFDVEPKNQDLHFTADLKDVAAAAKYVGGKGDGLFITYFSGQLKPISVPVQKVQWHGKKISVTAAFPFEDNVMFGLSVASLTIGKDFALPGDVVKATLAAPALIQVNDKF